MSRIRCSSTCPRCGYLCLPRQLGPASGDQLIVPAARPLCPPPTRASQLWAWTSVARMVVGRISITGIFSGARPGVESLVHQRFRSPTGVPGRPARRGAGGLDHCRADPPGPAGHAGRRALDGAVRASRGHRHPQPGHGPGCSRKRTLLGEPARGRAQPRATAPEAGHRPPWPTPGGVYAPLWRRAARIWGPWSTGYAGPSPKASTRTPPSQWQGRCSARWKA
jgi:hypothetical protein